MGAKLNPLCVFLVSLVLHRFPKFYGRKTVNLGVWGLGLMDVGVGFLV